MLKDIIYTIYLLSFALPFFKMFNVPVIKDWSWFTVIAPFWATTCIGLIVGWFVLLLKK
jgi:predicted lysophospholipase L1 biosynthesis ABC-type transport system permease subunit